ATSVVDDRVWTAILPVSPPSDLASPLWFSVVVAVVSGGLLAMSWRPPRNLFSRRQLMNASFDPLHLVNTYGAFGSVSRIRREVILMGTDSPSPGLAATWREYELKAKPGDPRRRPPIVAPYHLRLDWLM